MSKEYGDCVRWAMYYSLGCRVPHSSGVRVDKISFIIEQKIRVHMLYGAVPGSKIILPPFVEMWYI